MMIEKDPRDPKLHCLRVIHIYETNNNLLLGIKHPQLIHHVNDDQMFEEFERLEIMDVMNPANRPETRFKPGIFCNQ